MSNAAHQIQPRSILRYLVVGVTANGLGLAVFQGLVVLGVWPEFASLLSFFPAFLIAYLLNRNWSFGSKVRHVDGVTRYAIATLACVVLQVGIVWLLHRIFGVYPLIVQITALGIAVPFSFLFLKHWGFHWKREVQ